jgi:hypothetical protein
MNPEKDPPTHTGWSQRREHGKFREWYKRGHLWMEKQPEGYTVVVTYEGIPGPRGYDGFIHWYPNGIEPKPPPEPPKSQAQRPGGRQFPPPGDDTADEDM